MGALWDLFALAVWIYWAAHWWERRDSRWRLVLATLFAWLALTTLVRIADRVITPTILIETRQETPDGS